MITWETIPWDISWILITWEIITWKVETDYLRNFLGKN